MEDSHSKVLAYKRARFVTRLPVAYRYTRSHAWLDQLEAGLWRVGLTKFATRMLGEVVDHGFDTPRGTAVKPGQVVGWIEGFKAISDIFCVGEGEFVESNMVLKTDISLVSNDPHGKGWLYLFKGQPDPGAVDVQAYRAILDETIDRILEKQKGSETA